MSAIAPSLECVPGKYNAGLLFSQLPMDGSGDFTVTRATSATRVNGNGLIEVAKTNLAFHSEEWSTASNWNLANGVTRATGSTSAFLTPDNTLTANAISPTSGNVSHSLFSNSPTTITYVSGNIYTQSAFIKAGTGAAGRYAQLTFSSTRFSQAGFANFDLQNGTVTLVSGTSADTNRNARIENYGNGWYRCSFTATATGNGADAGFVLVLITASGDSRVPQFAGTITDVLYGWGAQVEEGSFASEYIPTTTVARTKFAGVTVDGTAAANIPRLDYLQPDGTIGCPALLVEPSAQNLALQSANFNTTWQSINSATVNTNTAISPDGTQNADTINLAAVNNSRVRQPITLANSTTYTISCFYKNIALTAGETFGMRFDNGASSPNNFVAAALIDLASGTATYSLTGTSGTGFSGTATGRVDNYGNGWYRVLLTFTVGSAGGGLGSFEVGYISPGAVRSFYAWGAQLELGSVATSYIPTTTAAVTRSADVITNTAASALIGQSEGTIYLEVDAPSASSQFFRINIGVSNAIHIFKNASSRYEVYVYASTNFILTDTSAKSGFVKIAIAYKSGESALVINGGSPITSATAYSFSAALNTINFLGGVEPVRPALIRAHSIYTTRLTNTQLALLTSPYTSYSSMASALSYTLG